MRAYVDKKYEEKTIFTKDRCCQNVLKGVRESIYLN